MYSSGMRQARSTVYFFFDSKEHLLGVTNSFINATAMLFHRLLQTLNYLYVASLKFSLHVLPPSLPFPQP